MTRADTFETVVTVDGDLAGGLVLVADHARRALPAEYGSLGLPDWEFERHIAYDIGVEGVTRGLAERLGAPAVMAGFSRLLVDPNRGADDPTLIRQLYDGTIIPGNYPMSAAEREKRLSHYFRPFHAAVWSLVSNVERASGHAPFVVSVHSFTPEMQGRARPWHIGILWDSDDRAVRPAFEMLGREEGLIVGDNEPYDGALKGDTMYTHCIRPGFAHLLIEIRQDLISDEAGQAEWADRLAPVLDAINRLPDIHVARQYGSRTGPVTK